MGKHTNEIVVHDCRSLLLKHAMLKPRVYFSSQSDWYFGLNRTDIFTFGVKNPIRDCSRSILPLPMLGAITHKPYFIPPKGPCVCGVVCQFKIPVGQNSTWQTKIPTAKYRL